MTIPFHNQYQQYVQPRLHLLTAALVVLYLIFILYFVYVHVVLELISPSTSYLDVLSEQRVKLNITQLEEIEAKYDLKRQDIENIELLYTNPFHP